MPNFNNGFKIINPLEEIQKIAPKKFTVPGGSSMDKARRNVQQVVKRANEKEESEKRYKEFLEEQRQEANKIRERRRKEYAEYDREMKEKKAKKEAEDAAEQEARSKKADENYEKSFTDWVDELAKYNDDYKGRLAKGVVQSQHNKEGAWDTRRWILKGMYNVNNMVGDLVNDATGVHLTELTGKKSYNDLKKAATDAHKQMLDYQNNINIIENQKQLLMEAASVKSPEDRGFKDQYNQIKQQIQEYNNQINAIKQKMQDPTLKQLDEEYKIDYVYNRDGIFRTVATTLWDGLKELSIGNSQQKAHLRKEVQDSRRKQMLSDYDFYMSDHNKNNIDDNTPVYQQNYEKNQKSLMTDLTIANNTLKQIDAENKEYNEQYKNTAKVQDKLQQYFKVADAYTQAKEANQNASLFSKNYWMYVAPGMIGSSNSSPDQIASNAIQYGSLALGAAVSMAGHPELGAGIVNAGGALAIPGQIRGGFAENYSEIGEKRKDKLYDAIGVISAFNDDPQAKTDILEDLKRQSIAYWRKQGRSEEWIKDKFYSGVNEKGKPVSTEEDYKNVIQDFEMGITKNNDPRLREAMLNSTKGLKAQFWADNARTMGEMPVQLAMNFLPTKPISKFGEVALDGAGKKIMSSKLINKVAQTKAGKVISKVSGEAKEMLKDTEPGTYSNGFRRASNTLKDRLKSGYDAGATVGESLGFGFGGRTVFGAAGAGVREAAHLGSKLLTPETKEFLRVFGERTMNKYQKVYDKLLPKDWMRIGARYGMYTARRGMMQAMSEGAEEGVQYLNSKEDFASKYGFGNASLGDLIFNDFTQGGRVAEAYLSLMGIGNSKLDDDLEFWQNVKGGFALGGMGGFHPGQIVNFYGNAKNMYNQYRTDQFIRESAVMNRERNRLDRAANVAFAEQAMNNREAEVKEAMVNMYQNDRRREEPEYTQDDYDEKIAAANGVMSLTKNEDIKAKLEAKGIKYGTKEYAVAIADLYDLNQQRIQNTSQTTQNNSELNSIYGSTEFNKAVDDIITAARSGDISIDLALSQARVKAGNEAVNKAIEQAKKDGVDTNTSEFKSKLQKIKEQAQNDAEEIGLDNYRQYIKEKTRVVNRLKALLKFKGQQNTAKEFFDFLSNKLKLKTKRPDSKTILNSTIEQIKQAKRQLMEIDPELNLGSTDADLLNAINSIQDIVNVNEDNAQQLELNSVALAADRAVTDSYLNQFSYGLVKNKQGKYEYNPTQYKREVDKQSRYLKALMNGNKEEAEKIQKEDTTSEYNEEEVKNNDYKTRVNKIREADRQNAKLNWMVADAYQEDLITKYMEQLEEERSKTPEAKPVKQDKEDPIGAPVVPEQPKTKWEETRTKREGNLAKSKEKYERRKAKAKEIYEKNKRKLRRNTYGSFIPALPQLAQAANYLLQKAKTSTYKIAQFVEDLKEIAEDIDIDSVLPAIKELYSKYAAKQALLNSDILNNLSSVEEIAQYGYVDMSKTIVPETDLYSTIQQTIQNDGHNIIEGISTYQNIFVNTENGVVICRNTESYDHNPSIRNEDSKYRVQQLKASNTSDESFKAELEKQAPFGFPVDLYVKYRNVEGVEEAAVTHQIMFRPSASIIAGQVARNSVLGILTGNEDAAKQARTLIGFDEFVDDIRALKNAFEKANYKIICANQMLYDVNTKTASQADIICIDNAGNLHVIDVLSSYTSIKPRWDKRPGFGVIYTIHQREKQMLQQIEKILSDKFGQKVKSSKILPITCDITKNNEIGVQKVDGKIHFIDVDTNKSDEEVLAEKRKEAENVVRELNEQIETYNNLARQLNSEQYKIMDLTDVTEQPSEEQYVYYISILQSNYKSVVNKINEINDLIQKQEENKQFYGNDDISIKQEIVPIEIQDKVGRLSFMCQELDQMLDIVSGLTPTTEVEHENVIKLYQTIFDAQTALDAVLKDPEARQVDVTKEEELIASAMEKLAENTKSFGQMSKFVNKWWLENFVIDNTNTGKNNIQTVAGNAEKYISLFHTIQSWTNTFYNHVLNDLHNRPVLQDWYDTLLNVYFQKLLNNAEKFSETITDEGQKTALKEKIQEGQDLIKDFNEQFGMQEDKVYPKAPTSEAEAINRISQKWTDLYSETTAHNPAWDAMLYNDSYYNMSQKPDFLERVKVSFYIAKQSKRYTNSRGYGYDIKQGDVMLYVEYTDKNGKKNWADLPLLISQGYKPSSREETLDRIHKVNNVNRKFSKIVKRALEVVSKDANKKISFTLSTNKGSIKYDELTGIHPVTDFLFKGHDNEQDLYTIQTSKENRIGVAAFTLNKSKGTMSYDVYAGHDLRTRIGGFDDTYQKQHLAINNGAIIYFYATGNNQYIGVPIETGYIGEDSAKRLVYLMQQYIQGNKYVDGYDIYGLLRQRLYMADPSDQKKLSPYNNISNRIVLNTNGTIIIGKKTYDIQTQLDELVKVVSKMSNNVNARLLNENLMSSNDVIFSSLRTTFKNTNASSITLPNGYVFTREDFTHQNNDGSKGSTWLGYMLRNNILQTRAIGRSYTQLNIDNFGVVDKNQEINTTKQAVVKQVKEEHIQQKKRNFRSLGNLTFAQSGQKLNTNSHNNEFIQSVYDYFDKVFGSHDFVQFVQNKYLEELGNDRYAIGLCCDQMIKLSTYAPRSVAYHEAFHRIMELILPDKVRQEFYDIYRAKNGKTLSDRKIAEAYADMYMDYMTNKDTIKQAKWYKKPFTWFRQFAFELGITWKLGFKNAYNLRNIVSEVNRGKYANKEISESKRKRFNKLFGDNLYYTVKNKNKSADFKYLANSGDVKEMVNALGYWIAVSMDLDSINAKQYKIKNSTQFVQNISQDIIDELCGNGLAESEIDDVHRAFREVFSSENVLIKNKKGIATGYTKVYPKLDILLDKVNEYIESTITAYSGKIEDVVSDEQIDDETEKAMSKNIDQYDKASFETSKLDSLPESVKFFLSTVPYLRWNNDEDGNKVLDYDLSKNKFLSPTFMPMTEVFSTLVNDLHYCSSLQDLDNELKRLSERREMYKYIYNKFHGLYKQCYKHNEDGSININYSAESYCAAILCALRSLKIDFITSVSRKQEYGKEITVGSSSLDRDKRMYSKQWTSFLISGQVSVFKRERDKQGHLIFREGMGGANNTDIFSRTANFIQELRDGLTSSNESFTIDGVEYTKSVFDDIESLKTQFIDKLNTIGIIFSKDALNNMLSTKYCGTDVEALQRLLTDKGVDGIGSFIDRLYKFVGQDGSIDEKLINNAYTENGFVKELGNQQGIYNRNTVESMALGLNGKKLHAVSQNNSISHIVNALNTRDPNNPLVHTLMKFGYNLDTSDGFSSGSIIMKMINDNVPFNIDTHIYIGSKTDNRGDGGTEYKNEPIVDDYVAKMAMTQQGFLIFPTLADKGTWMCLSGIELPGMKYSKSGIVENIPTIMWHNKEAYIRPSNQVLDQMLEYAKGERLAIQQCMEDLGYKDEDIPGYTKQGRKILSKAAYIKNYHTNNNVEINGETVTVEPNGTRFLSLTEIVQLDKNNHPMFNDDGTFKTINLNDPTRSSKKMLELANEYLFEKRQGETDEQFLERQRLTMAYTLNIQYRLEVQKAIDLGLVSRQDIGEYNSTTKKYDTKISKDLKYSMSNLDTHMLNQDQVQYIADKIFESVEAWQKLPNGPAKQTRLKIAKSLAIAIILSDTNTKSTIASQEVQRCFSGHPAMFKVIYEGDHIKDSTFDIQKRIGGMGSTGDDNVENLPNMKSSYRCAECKDYEVKSSSDVFNKLDKMFTDNAIRDMYGIVMENNLGSNSWIEAYEKPVDKLLNDDRLTDDDKKALQKAAEKGHQFYEAYTGGINVADGAAYITDQMCENLLRLRGGALTGRVKKAFDILRSGDKYSWMDKTEAYKDIYEAANIVSTKYTAYGFRNHTLNGEDQSDVAVAYYNKFALFPLFPCISTGNMHEIYNKMLNEKVDMLLMTSAVKVGSQGAVEYDGTTINKPFNVYEQDYGFLRRQQNTDPEEGDTTALGTQMVKVVLQNLRTARDNYISNTTGEKVTGMQILDSLMESINKLTEIGYQKVKEEFGIDENGKVDNKKLSDYLISQLSSRNANRGLIEALQLDENGNFKCPIAATSDSTWIESILISSINKRIIDIVTPGNSFVQRSVFAIEGSQTEGGSIQSDKDVAPSINGGKKLQMINEDHSMDAVISIDYFENILPKGLSFNEARQWLIDNNVIGQGARSNTIGYRIPTQAQSSIHALRFVDVIPAVKSTIILPEEFTKITGSDFDIDHLYLASFNYKKSEDGKTVSHDQFDPNSAEYHENNILNQMMTLLKDTDNSIHSLYKSIDNDTDLVTDIAKQIPEQGSNKSRVYNFGSLHEQVTRRNDYITGKLGIAPYALNVTSQVMTRCFGVSFKRNTFTESVGILNFDKLVDIDNNYVDSWISAFINAHADIVKDPYISKMNINQFTYNMSNLLIRSGFGEAAMWFLAQPIIRDMANASNFANSEFMRDENKFKTVYSAQKEAVANAVLNWLLESEASEDVLKIYTEGNQKYTLQKISAVNMIKDKKDVLKEIATHPGVKEVTVRGVKYNVREVQRDVFYAWKTLEKYSIALGNLVQKTKIDTKKHGKSFLAIYKYRADFYRMFYGKDEDSLWDMDSLHNLVERSWIKTKTDYACTLPLTILGNQTFNANNAFIAYITRIYNELNPESESLNVQQLEAISKAVQTQIKARYIADYAKQYLHMTDQDITNLFVGKRCMARRLNMLNAAIRQNDKYKRLANNQLIQQIYSSQEYEPVLVNGKRYDRPAFIAIADRVGDSSSNSDMLIDGWEDLLNDSDQFVRAFARDLIVYAYMTSGEYAGWNNLFKYVPPAWIRGEIDTDYQSMSSYVENILTQSDFDSDMDIDDLVANNFQDYKWARRLSGKTKESTIIYNDTNIMVTGGINVRSKAPKYVTVRIPGVRGNDPSNFILYRLLTYVGNADENLRCPVYVQLKKRGYDSGHKQKIYEYGWNFNYAENTMASDVFNMTTTPSELQYKEKNVVDNPMDYIDNFAKVIRKNPELLQRTGYEKLTELMSYEPNNSPVESLPDTTIPEPKENNLGFDSMDEVVMNSGGAYGADTAWDYYARKAGVKQINHYRDQGNQTLSSSLNRKGIKAAVLSKEEMDSARDKIFELLGKRYDNTIQGNLQVRNFYQVSSSDGVFAIATINSAKNGVSGGTNTAVQLGISLNKPTHVFDLNSEKWYKYDPNSKVFKEESTPVLTKKFAGVGTRDIQKYKVYKDGKWVEREQYVGDDKSKVALKAIEDVFNKTQAELSNVENNMNQVNNTDNNINYYEGNITPDANTIFVFGSNPEGRHGAGAAKVARNQFGAIYGQGEGLQGNAYALPTKDLRVKENRGLRSISEVQIIQNIKKLYEVAKQNPDKQFKVAYRNTDQASLNGYTGLEMIDMFIKAGSIPSNIVFSKEWVDTGLITKENYEDSNNAGNSTRSTSNKLPKNYTNALKQIEKQFIINNQTTDIVGNDNINHAIQELHIEINDKSLSDVSGKEVLNLLYKTSKFMDELEKPENAGITIVSEDYFYGDFAKKVKRLTGWTSFDIENNFAIQEGVKEKTMEIPNHLIKTLNFIESLTYKQRDILDKICDDSIFNIDLYFNDEQIDLSDKITITDTIEDTRQTDFLKELGMSDEDIKKAQEIKNHCKGGK